jgi:hypothetical protein
MARHALRAVCWGLAGFLGAFVLGALAAAFIGWTRMATLPYNAAMLGGFVGVAAATGKHFRAE